MSELSEFVEAFQAGYKMTKSKEEREWERELRKMKKEQHEWAREGDLADRAYRTEEFGFRKDRAAIGDAQWRDQFDETRRNRGVVDERENRDWAQREEALRLERERIQTGGGLNTDDQRTGAAVDDFVRRNQSGGSTPPGVDPTTTQAIPDVTGSYSAEDGALPVQLASYQPTRQSPRAAAQGAFNLNSYLSSTRSSESGGNDRAANPNSSARGRYQFLDSTWNNLAKKYPDLGLTPDGRFNPDQQERAMRRFTYNNAEALDRAGIPVTNGTLYAAHFLGDGGARKVLTADPRTPVSQLVGGSVVKANPFLSGMTVADFSNWAERKGNASTRRRGNRTVHMARGGMVTAIPEEDDDIQPGDELELAFAPEAEPDPAPQTASQTALPEEGPIPAPRYEGTMEGDKEEPTDDPYEQGRRAVRDGMKYALEQAGVRRAEQEALQSPETRAARERFAKGYGAGDQQILKQVTDLIDPKKEMPRSARNLRAIGMVYQFHLDQGNYEKAQAAAGQMAMALKQEALQFKAIAGAAAADGKVDEAARAAVAAYASVPNGIDFDIEKVDDKYQLTFTDEETGKKISQEILDPRQMAAAAMQLEEASFEDLIMQAAGIKGAERDPASSKQLSEIEEDGVKPYIEENPQIAELGNSVVREFTSVATDIAAEKENQLTGGGAAKFLHDMLQFNPDDLTDDTKPYTAKKLDNSKLYEITDRHGRTIRLSANGYKTLEALRGNMQGARTKAKEDSEKPGSLDKITESILKFGKATKENIWPDRPGNVFRNQPTVLPEMQIPSVDMDDPEIADLLEQEQQLRYQGVSDADPRMREIREKLDALGVE